MGLARSISGNQNQGVRQDAPVGRHKGDGLCDEVLIILAREPGEVAHFGQRLMGQLAGSHHQGSFGSDENLVVHRVLNGSHGQIQDLPLL